MIRWTGLAPWEFETPFGSGQGRPRGQRGGAGVAPGGLGLLARRLAPPEAVCARRSGLDCLSFGLDCLSFGRDCLSFASTVLVLNLALTVLVLPGSLDASLLQKPRVGRQQVTERDGGRERECVCV